MSMKFHLLLCAGAAALFGTWYGILRAGAPRRSRQWFGCVAAPVALALALRHAFALNAWMALPLVLLSLGAQRLGSSAPRIHAASPLRWRTAVYAGVAGAVLLTAGPTAAHAHNHDAHRHDAPAAHHAAAGHGYERLVVGESAPDFVLTNQRGERVALADLRGRAVLMTFLYTQCTDVCPVLVHLADAVASQLPEVLRERLTLVGITVDPVRDTPQRLATFMRERRLDETRWQLLTGSVAELTQVAADYGIVVRPAPHGDFVHNSVFYLIDAAGVEQVEYHGTATPLEALLADVTKLVGEP